MARCEMQGETNVINRIVWPFWLQICDVLFIPFIVWWSLTPTNVLNSSPCWKMLERAGLFGAALLFFTGILFGVIGLVKARKMSRLRIPTRVLAVINIGAGFILLVLLIMMFVAAAKGA